MRVGFINPGPSWTCFPAKARPSRRCCERRATPRPAQKPNDRPEGRSSLRPESLAKKKWRSLPTPARLSDRKTWSRRNDARFPLRPTSPTGRPVQGEDNALFQLRPASPTGRPSQGENNARFRLRPASPTGRSGQRGTALASDSDPLLRPGIH